MAMPRDVTWPKQFFAYNWSGKHFNPTSCGVIRNQRSKIRRSNITSTAGCPFWKISKFDCRVIKYARTHLTLIYVCTYIRLIVPLGCLIKQAGIIIHTILNLCETPGIEPVTYGLTTVYQTSSPTTWAIPPYHLSHSKKDTLQACPI